MNTYDELPDIFRRADTPTVRTNTQSLSDSAAKIISELSDQFFASAVTDAKAMADLLHQAQKTRGKERLRLMREDFFRKAHDIKGQGATFNYPLLTEVGAVLCDYLRYKKRITDKDLSVCADLLHDLETILSNNLTEDGGKIGADIRSRLMGMKK